jgi:integrase
MRLNDKTAAALTCPQGASERTYFDQDMPGFGLRVRSSGARSWLAQYAVHGKTRKVTLGTPDVVTSGEARAAARAVLAAKATGRDPAKEKAEAREAAQHTVGAILPGFLAEYAKTVAPKTLGETTRHLMQYCRPLHAQPVKTMEREPIRIVALLDEIERERGPVAQRKVRAALSSFFKFVALRGGLIATNPVAMTLKAIPNKPRKRSLGNAELAAVYNAVEGMGDYADIVRLLILTGLRRGEVADLRWSEIDLEAALLTLPGERTKTRETHTVPLSAQALAILKAHKRTEGRDLVFGFGDGGFQSFSVPKRELDARLGPEVQPWILHDLRRSVSTALHGEPFAVTPLAVEVLLGHRIPGVAGIYNKQAYLPERTAALTAWGAHVERIANAQRSAPLPIAA